ncbi:hypothetical protein, partial [Nitrosomonas sp. Nm51]|uniref:hypothetical protein n=1 Tax=Nitrosomonas sp. Nm51 TaxID=133720 RepID=UPI001C42FE81
LFITTSDDRNAFQTCSSFVSINNRYFRRMGARLDMSFIQICLLPVNTDNLGVISLDAQGVTVAVR